MRFIKIFIFLIFIFTLAFGVVKAKVAEAALDPFIPNCLGVSGKFYANNTWKGGYIEVGCAGDDGGAVNKDPAKWCKGQVQRVYPGKSFRLTKCSCFDKQGCLKIGKDLTLSTTLNANGRYAITVDRYIKDMPAFINNNCKINKIGQMCGSNGQIIKPTIKITCGVLQTKTPTPTGGVCPVPGKVTNVKISCPNCTSSSSTSTGKNASTSTLASVFPSDVNSKILTEFSSKPSEAYSFVSVFTN